MSKRSWIAIVLLLGVVGAFVVPNFMRARERNRATTILNDARLLDAAIDQWAIDQKAESDAKVTWADLAPYLKEGSRLRESGGKDMWGNPFIIGPTREDGVKFNPDSLKRYDSSTVPATFWEKYR